ncbi:hypothetical protein MKW92_031701 [Papaver armeniacum]|nr:hypothetical protein MKW92_031701 [Papaver armeniacum]
MSMLVLLSSLNLSYNYFSDNIPENIGDLSALESLDLSSNRLSGHIPRSLATIDSLEVINLSNNNLSGKIPRGTHFDTLSLDGSAFAGNDLLCGSPTKKVCEGDHDTSTCNTNLAKGKHNTSTSHSHANPSNEVDDDDPEDAKEKLFLCAIVALGFILGFWGLFFFLFLNKQKWWFPYWRWIDSIVTRITDCILNN